VKGINMANIPPSDFQKLWLNQMESLQMEYTETMKLHPDAVMKKLHALLDISRLAGCTPAAVGESPKWTLITQNVVETRKNLHQHLKGKALYSALCGVYTEVLHELKGILQSSVAPREAENPASETETTPSNEEFREQRRRKPGQLTRKAICTRHLCKWPSVAAARGPYKELRPPPPEVFRNGDREQVAENPSESQQQQPASSQIGRSSLLY
jgi:hypothetical protein